MTETSREGAVLSDKYQLIRKLGQGGMAVVYEARHRLVGRHFAVKLLQREVAANAEAVARFRREAEAAGALDCENVVTITDFGYAEDGAPYMVMELLKGEDLRSVLQREGPLAFQRALHLVLQACRALQKAHARSIVHRDLKPDNLFVTRREDGTEVVKVLDFGIAKLRHECGAPLTTQAGQMLGTIPYMPPEQIRGEKTVDHRVDVYALGAILYELLSGSLPHPGAEIHNIIYHILNQPPAHLATLRPGLPEDVVALVHQALSPNPENRPSSVDVLVQRLLPHAEPTNRGSTPPTTVLPSNVPTAFSEVTRGGSASTVHPVVSSRTNPHRGHLLPWVFGGVLALGMGLAGWLVLRGSPATSEPAAEVPVSSASGAAPVPAVLPVGTAPASSVSAAAPALPASEPSQAASATAAAPSVSPSVTRSDERPSPESNAPPTRRSRSPARLGRGAVRRFPPEQPTPLRAEPGPSSAPAATTSAPVLVHVERQNPY